MRNILILFIALCFVTGCDHLGSTKVKNIIDLTPKLEQNSEERVTFSKAPTIANNIARAKHYKLAGNNVIATSVTAKDIIYSLDRRGYLSAFSLKDKKILWSSDTAKGSMDRSFNEGGLLYGNEKLYVTNGTRNLILFDSNTGIEIHRKEFPDILRSKPALIDNNIVVAQTISNQLLAYNVKRSRFVWMHEGGLETISVSSQPAPIIYKGNVLAAYSSGEVVMLDAASGKEQWIYNLANVTDTGIPSLNPVVASTTPIIKDNYLYLATSNGKLLKIDIDNGAAVWSVDAYDIQVMSIFNENILIANNARQVAALSSHSGKVKWVGNLISEKERAGKKPVPVLFQPPFVSINQEGRYEINVVASNGVLYKFNQDSKGRFPLWPGISNIAKNVDHYWISCCPNILHLIEKGEVIF